MYVMPQQNFSAYNDSDRHPQKAIWGDYPYDQKDRHPTQWIYWFDDFTFVPSLTSATTAVNRWPYMSYIDTGNTIVALATTKTIGVLRLSVDASDNDGPVITLPGDASVAFMLDDNTAADRRKLWFDARWKKSSVTDNQCAVFIGLTEEARAVDNGLMADDSAAITTTIDAIGWRVLQDNGEELDFVWQKASQTPVELVAAAVTTTNSDATGLVADTYIKTGFKYDPERPAANRIATYINNVQGTAWGTATQMAAATFPDGEELVFAAGAKAGEATAVTFDIDWIRMAQKGLDV